MRVQRIIKIESEWSKFDFRSTYRMGWDKILAYVRTLYDFIEDPEVLTASILGERTKSVKIETSDDVFRIEECGVIEIRGHNKIYDGAPFQFFFYNQTDVVTMSVPTSYIDSFKKDENEYMNEEEQKRAFDKFMDSIEVNGEALFVKRSTQMDTAKKMLAALKQYDEMYDGKSDLLFKNDVVSVNLTELVNQLRK